MKRLEVSIDKCTGCQMCMLLCSFEQTGAFNIRYSKINVNIQLSGLPESIDFLNHCNLNLDNHCLLVDGKPACVEYCLQGAIEVFNGNSPDSI